MTERATASWSIDETAEGRCVRLAGHWSLLGDAAERERVARRLRELPAARETIWDLRGVESLDSAGALVLWRAWERAWPRALRCRPGQRRWFERLESLPPAAAAPPRRLALPLVVFGTLLVEVARDFTGAVLLVGQLLADGVYSLSHPRTIPWREISAGIYRIGASSLLLLAGVGLLIGVVATYQIAMALRRFGANVMVIGIVPLSVLRELSPVITALLVTARSGSAMTAEVGAMQLTEELDALRAFGSSPTQRLVLPRVIAMAVSMPLLVLWSDFAGMVGGIVTADLSLGVRFPLFMARLPQAVPWVNLWIGLSKGVIFGLIIAIVAGYFGLKVRSSTRSLSEETTNAVVASLTLIILIDAVSGALLTGVGLFG